MVYAFSYVYAPTDESRTLVLASDDDILAWLNGQRIHYHDVPRGVDHDRDTVEVRFAKGWNALLLKVVNRGGDFGFGAWIVGDSIRATNRRPSDAQPGNLPASTVAAGPLRLSGPVTWSHDTLLGTGTTTITTWGKNPPSSAVVSLSLGGERLTSDSVDGLVPGTPKSLHRPLDLATLSRVALDSTATLSTSMGTIRDARAAPLDPAAVLGLLDSRIDFGSWTDHGTTLETTVTVPVPFAGLSVDLLAAEFGPTAQYSISGQSRTLGADGTLPLCSQCAAERYAARHHRPRFGAPLVGSSARACARPVLLGPRARLDSSARARRLDRLRSVARRPGLAGRDGHARQSGLPSAREAGLTESRRRFGALRARHHSPGRQLAHRCRLALALHRNHGRRRGDVAHGPQARTEVSVHDVRGQRGPVLRLARHPVPGAARFDPCRGAHRQMGER